MGEQAKSSNPFVRVGTKGNAHSLLGMKMALEARFLAIVIVKNGFHPSFIKLVSGSQGLRVSGSQGLRCGSTQRLDRL